MSLLNLPSFCSAELKLLKRSAVFAMSLGAKELFQTNFIAFVLESRSANPPEAGEEATEVAEDDFSSVLATTRLNLLKLLFGPKPPDEVVVWREPSNLDLVITAAPRALGDPEAATPGLSGVDEPLPAVRSDKRVEASIDKVIAVVIEAKLKAVPTESQLRGYTAKLLKNGVGPLALEESERVLAFKVGTWASIHLKLVSETVVSETSDRSYSKCVLTARADKVGGTGTAIFAGIKGRLRRVLLAPHKRAEVPGWDRLDWESVFGCFPDADHGDDSLMAQLLRGYREQGEAIVKILAETQSRVSASLGDPEETMGMFDTAVRAKAWRQRRIHDLVGKYAYGLLEEAVWDCFREPRDGEPAVEERFELNGMDFTLQSEPFFSNGSPGLNFMWRAEDSIENLRSAPRRLEIGVQMQAGQYRHFMSASHSNHRPDTLGTWAGALGGLELGSFWHRLVGTEEGSVLVGHGAQQRNAFGVNAFLYTQAPYATVAVGSLSALILASLTDARARLSSPATKDMRVSVAVFLSGRHG